MRQPKAAALALAQRDFSVSLTLVNLVLRMMKQSAQLSELIIVQLVLKNLVEAVALQPNALAKVGLVHKANLAFHLIANRL